MSFLNNLVHFLEGNHGSGLSPNLPQGTSIGQQQPLNVGQALQSGGLTLDGQPNQLHVQPPHQVGTQLGVGLIGDNVQGGQYNPGYTPLQDSGFGPGGYVAGIQPAPYNQGPQNLGHQNPQLRDNGYFWNQ